MKKLNKEKWLSYPENKPEASKPGSKIFYHAQLKSEGMSGTAQKCWYSHGGNWLCDIFRSSVEVKLFKPCAKNAKVDIRINLDGEN